MEYIRPLALLQTAFKSLKIPKKIYLFYQFKTSSGLMNNFTQNDTNQNKQKKNPKNCPLKNDNSQLALAVKFKRFQRRQKVLCTYSLIITNTQTKTKKMQETFFLNLLKKIVVPDLVHVYTGKFSPNVDGEGPLVCAQWSKKST